MLKRVVGMSGIVFAVAACSGGAQFITDPDLLTYTAVTQVTSNNPMGFSTTMTITNGTTKSISFLPSCPFVRTVVYANASRTGTPIWDSNTRPPPPCAATLSVTLAPGKSVSYTLTATGAEVLGASGTAGTYYFVDGVTLDGIAYAVNAGQLSLAR